MAILFFENPVMILELYVIGEGIVKSSYIIMRKKRKKKVIASVLYSSTSSITSANSSMSKGLAIAAQKPYSSKSTITGSLE